MTKGIDYDIQRAGNLKSMIFGGEGLFLATLRGHGTVWLQSLPFSRMADRILASAPAHGGSGVGEGGVLGGIGRLIGGDRADGRVFFGRYATPACVSTWRAWSQHKSERRLR